MLVDQGVMSIIGALSFGWACNEVLPQKACSSWQHLLHESLSKQWCIWRHSLGCFAFRRSFDLSANYLQCQTSYQWIARSYIGLLMASFKTQNQSAQNFLNAILQMPTNSPQMRCWTADILGIFLSEEYNTVREAPLSFLSCEAVKRHTEKTLKFSCTGYPEVKTSWKRIWQNPFHRKWW